MPEGGHAPVDGPEALGYEVEFPLVAARTTIGSGADQDIVVEGLAPEHALIEWLTESDEFVFAQLNASGGVSEAGGHSTETQ